MNTEIVAIKLRQEEILTRVGVLEVAVGLAQGLKEEDEEREVSLSPPETNDLAQAIRSNRALDTAIWNQYDLLLSLSKRVNNVGTVVGEVKRGQEQRLDTIERNMGEVRDGIQSLIRLLTPEG